MGWAVGLQLGWQGPLATEPTSLCGPSWQKSWSWSCRANGVWRVNGGRLRAIGRPRLLTSLAGGYCGAGWDLGMAEDPDRDIQSIPIQGE